HLARQAPHAFRRQSRHRDSFPHLSRCAKYFTICVRESERRTGMFYSISNPEPATSDLVAQERSETEEQVADLFTGGSPLPAPAGRFGITDPQKWIDLCA